MAQQGEHNCELLRLSDTDLMLAQKRQDIRDRKVLDRDGKDIGHVDDLFIDVAERKVRMLQIRAGGFLGLGERHFLMPVDAISKVTNGEVHVSVTLEHVIGSPVYDPRLIATPTQALWGPYYGYYGISPYWGTGYMYPGFPMWQEALERGHRFAG